MRTSSPSSGGRRPFVVLLGQHRADEADDRGARLDGGSLGLVLGNIDPGAARQFYHRNDPTYLRRFILTSDDRLIETESLT